MRYAAIATAITCVLCAVIALPIWLSGSWRPAALSVFITAFPMLVVVDRMLQRLGVQDDWQPPEQSVEKQLTGHPASE
jgi:hypothetical protein